MLVPNAETFSLLSTRDEAAQQRARQHMREDVFRAADRSRRFAMRRPRRRGGVSVGTRRTLRRLLMASLARKIFCRRLLIHTRGDIAAQFYIRATTPCDSVI
jgi:hypothetical protein